MKSGKFCLWTNDIIMLNNFIYFSAGNTNALFKIDTETEDLKYVREFPHEDANKRRLHSCYAAYESKIIFAPDQSEFVAIYDCDTNDIYNIKYPVNRHSNFPKVSAIHSFDNKIFMFGYESPVIVVLDIKNNEFKVISLLVNEKRKFLPYFGKDICCIGHFIYTKNYHNNLLIEFNMLNFKTNYYDIGNEYLLINTLSIEKDNLWFFVNKERALGCWNCTSKKLVRTIYNNELAAVRKNFTASLICNNELWLFPMDIGNPIVIVNLENEKIEKIIFDEKSRKKFSFSTACFFAKVISDKIFCMMGPNVIYSIYKKELKEINLCWNLMDLYNKFGILDEQRKSDLFSLLNNINNEKEIGSNMLKKNVLYGKEIYLKEKNSV